MGKAEKEAIGLFDVTCDGKVELRCYAPLGIRGQPNTGLQLLDMMAVFCDFTDDQLRLVMQKKEWLDYYGFDDIRTTWEKNQKYGMDQDSLEVYERSFNDKCNELMNDPEVVYKSVKGYHCPSSCEFSTVRSKK